MHPLGRSPAYVEDEGPVFESAALCLHLADRHPEAGLIAAPGLVRARAAVPVVLLRDDRARGAAGRRRARAVEGSAASRSPRSSRRHRSLQRSVEVLVAALAGGDHLVGDRFSVADVVVGGVLSFARMAGIAELPPAIVPTSTAWRQVRRGSARTRARPDARYDRRRTALVAAFMTSGADAPRSRRSSHAVDRDQAVSAGRSRAGHRLVNAHIGRCCRACRVSVNAVMSQLEREPERPSSTPGCASARRSWRSSASAWSPPPTCCATRRGAGERELPELRRDPLARLRPAATRARPTRSWPRARRSSQPGRSHAQAADVSLPCPCCYGVPDCWPHLRDVARARRLSARGPTR